MNLHNINTIARYEVKLLRRSWLFRIFALLALLGIFTMLLADQTSVLNRMANIWPKVAVSSLMPFMAVYFYNIAQSVIVIFLAGSFLKRDKKLDTAEVIYVRPMSNADYIIGKTWGIMKVFIGLNLIVLLITAFLNLLVNRSPFSIFPYVFYLLTISVPSLLFVLGLAFTIMCLLKNQAVTFIVMLGVTGTVFFYMSDTLYGVFDFFGVRIPAIFSDVTGHADLKMFLLQRLIYLLAGIGFTTFTIALVKRLPHRPWKTVIIRMLGSIFLLAAATSGLLYVLHYNHQLNARTVYAGTFNRYALRNNADVLAHDLSIIPQGKSLQGKSVLQLRNPYPEALDKIFFYLNPSLQVTSVEVAGQSLPFTRENQVILVEKALAPGEEISMTLTYEGRIDETICYTDLPEKDYLDNEVPERPYRFGKRYAWLSHKFTLLTPECLWYPVTVAPVYPAAPYNLKKNFTAFTLTVEAANGQTAISQGERQTTDHQTVFRNSSLLPGISLAIGDYESKSLRIDSVDYEVYYFKGHDYFSSYFNNLKDTLPALLRDQKNDIEVSNNREYPFRKFTLTEVPVQFASPIRNWKGYTEAIQPEIVFLPERGATIDLDFRAVQLRSKEWRRHDQGSLSEIDIDINMLRSLIQCLTQENIQIGWNWQNQYINPYNIAPMFFNHSSFIRSDDFPVIDIALNTMLQSTGNDSFKPWRGAINDRQRANLYLENHSLKQAIADPDLKPEILYEVLKLKGEALNHYLTAFIPTEAFQQFLKDFFYDFRFRNIPFEIFNEALEKRFGKNLKDFMAEWYSSDQSPVILVREADANQVVIDEQTKYQTRFCVYNPSEKDAIITVSVLEGGGGGFRGRMEFSISQPVSSNYIIPAGQAFEIKSIYDERPVLLRVSTNISRNLPEVRNFNFPKIESTTQDTSAGIRPIHPDVFRPNPNEIIIDNEDPGFRTISSNNKHKLKDLFRKKDEEKYKNFTPWWHPSQWTVMAGDYCYGEVVSSAVYKNKGSGANSVEWKAEMPKDGYYEVFIWNSKSNMFFGFGGGRGGRRHREERNQTYTIEYEENKENITLDLESENSGWVSLGSFYFPQGPVSITLTDKVSGSYVIADAVKFTLNE